MNTDLPENKRPVVLRTPFTTNIVSNSFNHVPIKVEIITYIPGEAIVNFQGHTHVVSGNTTVIIK